MRYYDMTLWVPTEGPRKLKLKNTATVDLGGAAATTSGGDATGSTGSSTGETGTTTGGSTTGTTGTTSETGSSTGTQPTDGEIRDGDWRTLRTKYDTASKRAAILDSLGLPEAELGGAVATFKAIHTEVTSLAKELGYTDEADVKAAFQKDPAGTLALLRKEKAEAATRTEVVQKPGETNVDYEKRIREEVEKQTKPYTEHINKQISDAVTAKIGTEFDTAYKAALPDTPQSVRDLVEDYVIEHLTGNPDILAKMKVDGKYDAVHDTVKIVAGRLKSVFAEWVKAESTRSGNTRTTRDSRNGEQTQTGKRPTLDEMINDPSLINPKYV